MLALRLSQTLRLGVFALLSLAPFAPGYAALPWANRSGSGVTPPTSGATPPSQHSAFVRQQIVRQPITFFALPGEKANQTYGAHLPGYDLQVHGTGMTIDSHVASPVRSAPLSASDGGLRTALGSPEIVRRRTNVEFVGANRNARLEPLDQARARVSRLIGSDPSQWQRNMPTCGRMQTHDLYPGVDLIYYGSDQGSLEYDLVLAPHADLQQIRFRSRGNEKAVLEKDGSLDLDGQRGSVRFRKPVLYQDDHGDRKAILGNFVELAPKEFGFQSVAYNHDLPLIVDPTINLVYATYAGGIHNELEFHMALDTAGNAYIVGEAASEDFPVTGNALQSVRKAIGTYTYDTVVLKFDASGTLLFSTF